MLKGEDMLQFNPEITFLPGETDVVDLLQEKGGKCEEANTPGDEEMESRIRRLAVERFPDIACRIIRRMEFINNR